MSTLLIKCRCCGAEIQFLAGEETRRCVHCQAVNPRPQANTPEVPNIMNLAVEQRLQCEFYHAEQSYRRALEIEKDNYEARWGLVLCKYGVEYVRDRSGRYLPICHTIRVRPMQEDMDYQSAYELAPEEIRAGYKRDAAYIDAAQQRIRVLRREDAGYDIFLCYKETTLEDVNQQTAESRDARRLYNDLSRVGYRVFYAPETLQEEAGENYEAGIYHAIETAKVMLVIGRKQEHLLSGWVQSEWSRFLEHMEKDQSEHLLPSKHLLPLYAEMRERELPEPFAHWGLQALSMEKPEWRLNLESSLVRLIPRQAGTSAFPAVSEEALRQQWKAIERQKQEYDELIRKIQEQMRAKPRRETRRSRREEIQEAKRREERRTQQYTSGDAFLVKPDPDNHNSVMVYDYEGYYDKLNIPHVINGKRVTKIIGDWDSEGRFVSGFGRHSGLTSIIIPNSVTRICTKAFFQCMSLTEITIPDSVFAIGNQAFQLCTSLTKIKLPHNVTEIGAWAFHSCSNLRSAVIPDGVSYIKERTFWKCSKLTSITIPNSVSGIGQEAFGNCKSLEFVMLPDNITYIDKSAFDDNITICCSPGSYAAQWANNNDRRFQLMQKDTITSENKVIYEALCDCCGKIAPLTYVPRADHFVYCSECLEARHR